MALKLIAASMVSSIELVTRSTVCVGDVNMKLSRNRADYGIVKTNCATARYCAAYFAVLLTEQTVRRDTADTKGGAFHDAAIAPIV